MSDFFETLEVYKDTFYKRKLQSAWKSVIAVELQPRVEFGDETIHE